MPSLHAWMTMGGYAAFVAGLWLTYGVGVSLIVGGTILFVAGGLGEIRTPRP